MAQIERSKSTNSNIFIIIGLAFSFLLISSSLVVFLYPFPSKEKISYSTLKNPIVTNSEIYKEDALIEDGIVYFPLSYIQETIDDSIIIDESSKSIILTTRDKVYQMPSESLTYFVNEEPHQLEFPIYKIENDIPYISIDPFQGLYQIEYEFISETGITVVRINGETIQTAFVKGEQKESHLFLRSEPTLTSPYAEGLEAEDLVYIEDEQEDYYYVRKENGIAGYVKKNILKGKETSKLEIAKIQENSTPIQVPSMPVNLTWEAVYTKNPDTSKIPEMPGVNVVSPTWFSLKNKEGDIENLGSTAYINWAKAKNYQVWGLFSNDFDPDKTHEAFKDFETRKKMIRQLLEYSGMYQLDGINLDIENVYEEDGPLVTQFVKEATPFFHEAGLVVSMDVTFISSSGNWSKFYEREKLAEVVDYMIVMAYDEHWGTSPVAGSVASLPWVEGNLQDILELVPNDKLILGVPLYTRLWKEADTAGGNIEVSSKAYSMEAIQEWIKARNLVPVLDEASGQNYVEYRDENEKTTYKVWLEDELSIKKRIQLIHNYDLAGVASWSRFFADETAWTSISTSIGDSKAVNND
ncbi:glycosyl hydrolase family 18 protein [Fredinandcohnia humi]